MLLKTLIMLAVIVVAFVIIVALRPSDFRVVRSATINAPAEAVFAQINDLHNYEVWNPWGKYDPNIKITFDGPRAGRDAAMSWVGNNQVGSGRMTITESVPGEVVRARLDFLKPFPSTATAEFTLVPHGAETTLTWSMFGRHTFVPKAAGLFMNMDKMIGGEFEKGFAQMKSIVETPSKK